MDMFVVPTISFRLLYGLLIMGHGRRHILWFGVTAHPTAEWIANQITEACGWEQAPRYLIRDRDGAYGEVLIRRLRSIGIRDRPTSPRSPWQNGYAERLIGSIRRECLDHVIVFSEHHLRNLLLCYMKYYNGTRAHLSLEKDAPVSRERLRQFLEGFCPFRRFLSVADSLIGELRKNDISYHGHPPLLGPCATWHEEVVLCLPQQLHRSIDLYHCCSRHAWPEGCTSARSALLLSAMDFLTRDHMLADVSAIIRSLDIVFGEIDR